MQNSVKSYSILRPVQTAGRSRLRQSGAPGRRRTTVRALPRALRLLRELVSHSLLSDQAAILLNIRYNGDSPVDSAPPAP